MRKPKTLRVFGFTDIHWEQRDRGALAVAMSSFETFKPDITVIGGDLLDCAPFSRHPRKKMVQGLGAGWAARELEPALEFLDWVQMGTGKHTYFLEGNHEEWLERFCTGEGPAFSAVYDLISPRSNITRNRKQFSYVPYTNTRGPMGGCVKLNGQLHAVHGWTACKHAAARHVDLSRTRSVIFHHTHRRQMHSGRDPWTGRPIEAMSAGCLCKLHPIYAHGGSPTEWSHGFWVAYVSPKSHTMYAVPIYKNSAVLPDGRQVRA